MTLGRRLEERLAAAGVAAATDPVAAWTQLHAVEGPRTTVLDLYELVAAPRGIPAHELPAHERHTLARSVMPLVWPGFDVTSGSERTGDTIHVVDYDQDWPRRFARWADTIARALGPVAIRIEHVGSTSVPGLPAKPIVDIQVGVAKLDDEVSYVPALEGAGVQLRSRDDLHRYFRPFPGQSRDVHVHVCRAGSGWEAEHLLFRDYLRAHPHAQARYAAAKREAAAWWADDGIAYTDAKSEVILDLLEAARDWHSASSSG